MAAPICSDTRSRYEKSRLPLRRLGVPYPDGYETKAADDMRAQATQIAAGLQKSGLQVSGDREIVAMIAYLQRLGTDIKSQGAR